MLCKGADLDSLAQRDSKRRSNVARSNVAWLVRKYKTKFVWRKPHGNNGRKFRDFFSYIGDKCQVIYFRHVKAHLNERREEAKVDKWKPALISSIAQEAFVEQKRDAECH